MAQTVGSSTTQGHGADPSLQDRRWGELGLQSHVKMAILGVLFCILFRDELASIIHLWITDPSWSHGFLIPLFSLYFVHQSAGRSWAWTS